MSRVLARLGVAIFLGLLSLPGTGNRAFAQTYPIDCAILLCLSGGWPASVPCSRARAEFIRRITPWPIEPPLQIWRCPMGAAFQPRSDTDARIYDILFDNANPLLQSFPKVPTQDVTLTVFAMLDGTMGDLRQLPESLALQLVQDRADIDISGPEFNFVRSIRVYDVRYASQRESGPDDDCNRSAAVVLGTYGLQGSFSWQPSAPTDLPGAHIGLERWGEHCPNIHHRSVFVDWRDYEGNYGFEQVNY